MSWENEDYAPNFTNIKTSIKSKSKNSSTKKVSKSKSKNTSKNNSKSISKNKSKSGSKNKSQSHNTSVVLTYENKGLTEFPDSDPDWTSTKILLMKSNNLEILDASKLPRNLELLDLRYNKIREVKGEFPETLTTLWLDENQLSQLPVLPATVTAFTYDGNPIVEKNILSNSFNTNKSKKYLIWFSSENATTKFNDIDINGLNIKFNTDDNFNSIKTSIEKILDKKTTCRDKIGRDYINKSIKDAENIIVEVLNDTIVAFSVFTIYPASIYIDVICSNQTNKGGGSRIINMILSYFNNHPEYHKITLQSLTDARSFYETKGFKPCIQGETCPMEYIKPSP